MHIKASEIQVGQHFWHNDQLRLAAAVRTSSFTQTTRVTVGTGDIFFGPEAEVVLYEKG